MIDHVILPVRDYGASKRFYERALRSFGYELLLEFEQRSAGFGRDGKPDFWIREGAPGDPVHVAFASPDRTTVHAFHEGALAAGGSDNGAPGLREHYHATYYAAFVRDPDGHNIEAVTHRPE